MHGFTTTKLLIVALLLFALAALSKCLEPLTSTLIAHRVWQVGRALLMRDATIMPVEARMGRVVAHKILRATRDIKQSFIKSSNQQAQKQAQATRAKTWSRALRKFCAVKIVATRGKYPLSLEWFIQWMHRVVFAVGSSGVGLDDDPSILDQESICLPFLISADLLRDTLVDTMDGFN